MPARTPDFALVMILVAATAVAAPLIENPATPMHGVQTITLVESWRAGGDDDEVFFGSVGRIMAGPDGQLMVLDTQQNQVQVYDRHGEFLHSLGREGEGPGEMRNPADMVLTNDGRLCIPLSFPGRMVYLNLDGTPGGQSSYQPLGEAGTFSILITSQPLSDGILLAGFRSTQNGPTATQDHFLSRCDDEGVEQVVYLTKQNTVNYADFRLDEGAGDFVLGSLAVADQGGRVYTAPDRNRYLVRVQDPDGSVSHEFTRAVSIPERTAEQHEIAVKIQEAIAAYYNGIPLQGITVEKTERAINSLWGRPDGEIWVSTPANTAPDGAFILLDCFSPEGEFLRQVALELPGDPSVDSIFHLADGRVVKLVGGLDAWFSQQGVENTSDEAPVLEIVVYEAI